MSVFACIFYPSDDWDITYFCSVISKLDSYILSPLHHGDSEESKNHIHVMIRSTFSKEDSFNEFFKKLYKLDNVTRFFKVNSVSQYTRYLIHLDNPEKEQFKISDLKKYKSWDLSPIFQSSSEFYLSDLLSIIERENLVTFKSVVFFLTSNGLYGHLKYFASKSYFFRSYLE